MVIVIVIIVVNLHMNVYLVASTIKDNVQKVILIIFIVVKNNFIEILEKNLKIVQILIKDFDKEKD